MYFHFTCFLYNLGILTYKWQVDFNKDQINVEVTFKKTSDMNQNSQSPTNGNVERPIDSMRYHLYNIPFIDSWLLYSWECYFTVTKYILIVLVRLDRDWIFKLW